MTLEVRDGCAKDFVRRAAEAGIVLTPAGATHPWSRRSQASPSASGSWGTSSGPGSRRRRPGGSSIRSRPTPPRRG
ncbi:hypothetical protein [Streptomyces rectiverticillatus]|uniref:hypothetical protein n=1 Tax=Streptomyces rectiverticillatus TaxID=173860 RepID=UPI003CCD48D8